MSGPPPGFLPPSEDAGGRKLIILGLSWDVTDEEFGGFFSAFAGVQQASVVKNHFGVSRGFGFVTFDTPEAAQAVLTEHEHRGPLSIKGRRIDPKIALPKGQVGALGRPGFLPAAEHAHTARTTRIFVARVPPTVASEELKAHFEQYGEVLDCYMPLNFGTRVPRGIGFLTFAREETVELVMQHTHEVGGRAIAVDRAAPKPDDAFGFGKGKGKGYYGAPPAYPRYPSSSPYGPYGATDYSGWMLVPPEAVPRGYSAASRGYAAYRPGGYGAARPYQPRAAPGPMGGYRARPAYHPYA